MHLSISLCISQMFIGHTHYYISFSVVEGTTITTLSLIYLYNRYYIYILYVYSYIYIYPDIYLIHWSISIPIYLYV